MTLKSCVRRSADSIDKRFCLDLTVQMHDKEKGPTLQVLTMQTLSEEDCKRWMDAMDGKEPVSTMFYLPVVYLRTFSTLIRTIFNFAFEEFPEILSRVFLTH